MNAGLSPFLGTEKASGKNTERPALIEMMKYAREGDTVIVHSMDRLARNLDDLKKIVKELTGKGVKVKFIKENLEFTGDDTAIYNLLLSVKGITARCIGACGKNQMTALQPVPTDSFVDWAGKRRQSR